MLSCQLDIMPQWGICEPEPRLHDEGLSLWQPREKDLCDKPTNKDCDTLSMAVGGGAAADCGGGGAEVDAVVSADFAVAAAAAAAGADAVAFLVALADVVAAVAADADAVAAVALAADADSIAEAFAAEKWEETLAHAKTAWDNDEVVDKPSIDQNALDLWLRHQPCTFCMKRYSFDHTSARPWIPSGFYPRQPV